jgi:hypothetical protein
MSSKQSYRWEAGERKLGLEREIAGTTLENWRALHARDTEPPLSDVGNRGDRSHAGTFDQVQRLGSRIG